MKPWERELHVSRIVAGRLPLTIGEAKLILGSPSRDHRVQANEIYREMLRESELSGVIFQEELECLMYEQCLWTDHEQEQLTLLIEKIDDMKAELYMSWNQSNKRLAIRTALQKGHAERNRLENKKHSLDYMTCEGLALAARHRFLVGCSLLYRNGTPYWPDPSFWTKGDPFIDKAMERAAQERLSESEFRELANNEPWRSHWGGRSVAGRGVFDVASVDMTDDQRTLVLWSTILDSIRESPNCPPDSVFAEDDMLDGWMIVQRRRREAELDKQMMDDKTKNSKVKNSDEVFYMAETDEDVKRINKLNDATGMMIKQQRMNFLKEKKEVHELLMPDTWMRFQTEAAKQASAQIKGR